MYIGQNQDRGLYPKKLGVIFFKAKLLNPKHGVLNMWRKSAYLTFLTINPDLIYNGVLFKTYNLNPIFLPNITFQDLDYNCLSLPQILSRCAVA